MPSRPSILGSSSNNTLFALPVNETNTSLGVWPNLPYSYHIEGDLYLNIQEYGRVIDTIPRGDLKQSLMLILLDIILDSTIIVGPGGRIVTGDIDAHYVIRERPVSVQFTKVPYSSSWLTSTEAMDVISAVMSLADTPEPPHEIRFAWIVRARRQIGRFEMMFGG